MRVFNLAGFACSRIVTGTARPDDTLVFVVKATADMAPGAAMAVRPAAAQQRPCLDRRDPDGEADEIRYPSDFAARKDSTDILIHGRAHAPGGRPVPSLEAALTIGNRRWGVAVHGERAWRRDDDGAWVPGPARPFVSLPLAWRHARGGRTAPPRIEDPDHPARRRDALPAAFAPAAAPRRPAVPLTGNAAPERMRLDGYLRGDERLRLTNLHPAHPALEAALPGVRLRLFVNRLDAAATRAPSREERARVHAFAEVAMDLDTLWLAPEEETGILVWRGRTPIGSRRHPELLHALVVAEPLDGPAGAVADYAALLAELLRRPRPGPMGERHIRAVADAEIREAMAGAKAALDKSVLPADVIARLRAEDDPYRFLEIIAAAAQAQYGTPAGPEPAEDGTGEGDAGEGGE